MDGMDRALKLRAAAEGTSTATTDPVRGASSDLATELESLPEDARLRVVRDVAERTGGSLIAPRMCGNRGSRWAELHLLGVSAAGEDESRAVAGWIKAVRRMEREEAPETPGPQPASGEARA